MSAATPAEVFLDRFEGELAILLWGEVQLSLPRALLPAGVKEGEVLILSLTRDPVATRNAQERVAQKRAALNKKDDGGDFSL